MTREQVDVEEQRSEPADDPAEHAERFERLAHAAEALRRLKPQEITALVLRAEGLSYKEICERTSWTYTRCNRAVTEGRRALRKRLHEIESGAECERWLPLLSLLADGEASARELADLRPHLRGCSACRATLRAFHEAPGHVGALMPVALLPVAAGADTGGVLRQAETVVHWVLERATASALRMQGAIDALPGAKVAAVAASTVAVAGGGAAIEHAATRPPDRGRPAHTAQVAAAGGAKPVMLQQAAWSPTGSAGKASPPTRPSASAGARSTGGERDGHDGAGGETESEFALEPKPGSGERKRARAVFQEPATQQTPPPADAATSAAAGAAESPPSSSLSPPPPAAPAPDPSPPVDTASSGGEFGGFESTTEP